MNAAVSFFKWFLVTVQTPERQRVAARVGAGKVVCPSCGHVVKRLGSYCFSFNSVHGMCLHCMGRGYMDEIDIDKIIGDGDTTLSGICRKVGVNLHKERYDRFLKRYHISGKSLFSQIPSETQDIFLSGRPGVLKGVLAYLAGRPIYERMHYTKVYQCTECRGHRLRPAALRVTIEGRNISELSEMPIKDIRSLLLKWLDGKRYRGQENAAGTSAPGSLSQTAKAGMIADGNVVTLNTARVILQRLRNLEEAGLGHLTLYRPMPTLSGGEGQRLFLASHLESEMSSVIYIFDEPTSGLHEKEKQALIRKLIGLKKNNNTVIAIEHDRNTIQAAEHIIDFGPLGGDAGGEIIGSGYREDLLANGRSITAAYLNGTKRMPERKNRRRFDDISTDDFHAGRQDAQSEKYRCRYSFRDDRRVHGCIGQRQKLPDSGYACSRAL